MFSVTLVHFHVLSVGTVFDRRTQSSAHSASSGCIQGRIVANPNYVCPRCCGQTRPIDGRPVSQVDVDGTLLDIEASFCYLGDMLGAGGGFSLPLVQISANNAENRNFSADLLPQIMRRKCEVLVRGNPHAEMRSIGEINVERGVLSCGKPQDADILQKYFRNKCRTRSSEPRKSVRCGLIAEIAPQ